MIALLTTLRDVAAALWGIGNYWLRAAIIIVASWPLLIVLAALIGWPALTATMALLPLAAAVGILLTIFDPAFLAILALFGGGRRALVGMAGIIGLELAIGAYFSAVPVATDRGLIPLQLLLIVGIIFLAISGFRRTAVLLGLALAVTATILFMGGREEAKTKLQSIPSALSSGVDYPLCAETAEGVELTLAKPKAEMPLNPKCWSGWVTIVPDNVDFRLRRDGGNPGLEAMFADGQRLFLSQNERKFVGKILNANTRLRGEGVVTITIEPKQSAKM